MSEEEKELLRKLFQKDEKTRYDFTHRYKEFVRKDVMYHLRLGLVSKEDVYQVVGNVLGEFSDLAATFDLSDSTFTIEQLLHLLTVSHAYEGDVKRTGRREGHSYLYRFFSDWPFNPSDRSLRFASGALAGDFLTRHARNSVQFIQAETEHTLTPEYLSEHLMPYLNALAGMQHTCDKLMGHTSHEVVIRFISQQSPVSISLQGVSDAVNAVLDVVVPWRREYAKQLAELKLKELEAEIKKKKKEADEIASRSAKQRAEAANIEADTETKKIDGQKTELELDIARYRLAREIVATMRPDLTEAEQMAYIAEMMPDVKVLTTSEIEIKRLPR